MGTVGNRVKRWRTALHVALSATLVTTAGLASVPVARAAAAAATLSVSSTWQTGFIAHFTVTNSSSVPMSDWRLEFDMPSGESVSHAWSSTVTQSGTHFVVSPVSWNRIIPPGGSATGGMRGVLSGTYSPPVNCQLNRQYRCS
ncbi:cellulose-binding domain-containing protein [Candidatus Mycobacterium wuenschmannii]|uniref:Cellulose-binding domain-containing protein n=1 Tax=Candidatus Mycobacterium wuenschmannii TaxID=3027808 RepID=A0ABY8VSZ0_9MYCO|nr:cellulose-binding domain-containing protein [Candidatus Mycobacterium wuenschmannii]WIM86730.1 cellulose-binding domain-containing protein [Candidatus Mycobacterium wuenschmannii]